MLITMESTWPIYFRPFLPRDAAMLALSWES